MTITMVENSRTILWLGDFFQKIKDMFMPTSKQNYGPYDFIEDFDKSIYMPKFLENINDLAVNLAEKEDWAHKNLPAKDKHPHPVLENYIKFTYKKLVEEGKKKIVVSKDETFACWNTGLVTGNQQPIYMLLIKNFLDDPDRPQYWHFGKFVKNSDRELDIFGNKLPEMAHYFDDPSILVYDSRKELKINYDHIFDEKDHYERFPEYIRKTRSKAEILKALNAATIEAKGKVRRNYKIAVPQYYLGNIQLLLPLCLVDDTKVDIALVIERVMSDDGDFFYRANTIFPLDWAYNSARQITKPGNEWL